MNTLTLRDLCCLFCCPPFPSNIAAKLGNLLCPSSSHCFSSCCLAFLPPEPTYILQPIVNNNLSDNGKQTSIKENLSFDENPLTRYTITFSDKAEWQHSQSDITRLEAYFVRTSRNRRIACFYVNCIANPKFYILFSHGNAVDLGNVLLFIERISL